PQVVHLSAVRIKRAAEQPQVAGVDDAVAIHVAEDAVQVQTVPLIGVRRTDVVAVRAAAGQGQTVRSGDVGRVDRERVAAAGQRRPRAGEEIFADVPAGGFREPDTAVRAGRDAGRLTAGRWHGEEGDLAGRCDPADLVGVGFGEPEVAVRARRNGASGGAGR